MTTFRLNDNHLQHDGTWQDNGLEPGYRCTNCGIVLDVYMPGQQLGEWKNEMVKAMRDHRRTCSPLPPSEPPR